jgi:hypothetical protein
MPAAVLAGHSACIAASAQTVLEWSGKAKTKSKCGPIVAATAGDLAFGDRQALAGAFWRPWLLSDMLSAKQGPTCSFNPR